MTRKVYRTAQGKLVDLGKLQLQNEHTRAVGNMGVNARGDRIDSQNRPIERRPASVKRQYSRQLAAESGAASQIPNTAAAPAEIPPTPEDFDDNFERQAQPTSGGLAAAIAKARQIKQEPIRQPNSNPEQGNLRKL